MNLKKQFTEGLLTKNPVTVQLLGMCSTLAITTSLFNGHHYLFQYPHFRLAESDPQ